MAGLIVELDAASSNPDGTSPGTALLLTDAASGWQVMAFDPGTAEPEYQLASSVDTEGSVPVSGKHQNRTVTMTVHVAKSTSALLRTALDTLGQKVGKIFAEGGTLKLTLPDATVRFFDLVGGDSGLLYNKRFVNSILAEVTLRLPARPYMRGAEVDLGDNIELTLPSLIFTDTGVTGDVPGLGRLVIDNDQAGVDQRWVTWGIESKNYSSSANAALFYEAEGRTALGVSAIAAGPAGASGAGSNVMRNTSLLTSYQAILSTQATGAGAHLSHIGTFRVYARVQIPTTNTGITSVALEWGEGDFRRFTQNAAEAISATFEGQWVIADLGLVSPQKVTAGTQRWEGRVVAKSTVSGDDIDVDWLVLVPADEGSGVVSAVQRVGVPTVFSARDEFDQAAGALTAKTLPVGGTWVGTGDADDFVVETTGKTAQRGVVGQVDAGNGIHFGRIVTASTPTSLTGAVVQVDGKVNAFGNNWWGVVARVNTSANLFGAMLISSTPGAGNSQLLDVHKRASSTTTQLVHNLNTSVSSAVGVWYTLKMAVLTSGHWYVWGGTAGEALPLITSGWDADLATGGVLASGGVGFFDNLIFGGASAELRNYDNFAAWAPPEDAAIFASQSLELRSDRVTREDSGGTLWVTPSSYEGDYLLVPPAGAEARTNRVIVKASRNPPGSGPDSGTDDISARLFVTPRFL